MPPPMTQMSASVSSASCEYFGFRSCVSETRALSDERSLVCRPVDSIWPGHADDSNQDSHVRNTDHPR